MKIYISERFKFPTPFSPQNLSNPPCSQSPTACTYRKGLQEHQTLNDALHCVARQTERARQMATLSTDGRRQRCMDQGPSVALGQRQTGRQWSRAHESLQRVHSRLANGRVERVR